jgi:hypothetical protein
MDQAAPDQDPRPKGEVIDFDEALLSACPGRERVEVMAEATLLAQAFAPDGRAEQIASLARALQSGVRDLEIGRAHARRLAAALRRLARDAQP